MTRLRDRNTRRRDFYLAAAELAQARVADRAGRAPATLGGEEIIAFSELEEESSRTVRTIFGVRDEMAFAGREDSATVSDEERSAALEVLRKLEQVPAMATK